VLEHWSLPICDFRLRIADLYILATMVLYFQFWLNPHSETLNNACLRQLLNQLFCFRFPGTCQHFDFAFAFGGAEI